MTTSCKEFIVQGRVPTFSVLLVAALGAGDKYFCSGSTLLLLQAHLSSSPLPGYFSKEKSIMTVAFSIGLRVGSTTACVVQIRRCSLQDFILNDGDEYSTCKSPRRAGYSER